MVRGSGHASIAGGVALIALVLLIRVCGSVCFAERLSKSIDPQGRISGAFRGTLRRDVWDRYHVGPPVLRGVSRRLTRRV